MRNRTTLRKLAILLPLLLCPLSAQNPVTPVYPGALATDTDLLVASNRASTTLTASIDSSTLSIPVTNGSVFTAPLEVTIEDERIHICTAAPTSLTVCSGGRGFDGSSAASHNNNRTVVANVSAYFHNVVAAEIKAIETALGANLSAVRRDYTNALDCGMVGNGTTNDAAALRTCMTTAQAANHHHLHLPATGNSCPTGSSSTACYKIQMGDHLDANFSDLTGNWRGVAEITTNGFKFDCDPGVTIQVVSTHMSPDFAGPYATPPTYAATLFGINGSVSYQNLDLWQGCRLDFITSGSANILTTVAQYNAWFVFHGAAVDSLFHDTIIGDKGDQDTVVNCTNTTPAVLTTSTVDYRDGETATITGVVGNTACNGRHTMRRTGVKTFNLEDCATAGSCTSLAGNGAYVSGGSLMGSAHGFPGGISIIGFTDIYGQKVTNNTWRRVITHNYGGSDNDCWGGLLGGDTFTESEITSLRQLNSCALYDNQPAIGAKVVSSMFRGQNKRVIEINSSSGTFMGEQLIADSFFLDQGPNVQSILVTNNSTTSFGFTFSNLQFDKASWTPTASNVAIGILNANTGGTTITNVLVRNFLTGVTISNSTKNVQVVASHFQNVSTAFDCGDSSGFQFNDNFIEGYLTNATKISLASTCSKGQIHNNILRDVGDPTATFESYVIAVTGSDISVKGNRIIDPVNLSGPAILVNNNAANRVVIEDNFLDVSESFPGSLGPIAITGGQNLVVRGNFVRNTGFTTPPSFDAGMTGPCLIEGNDFTDINSACPNTTFLRNTIANAPTLLSNVIRAEGNYIASKLDTIAPAYATPYTPNAGLYRVHRIGTLTGNITINAPTNPYDGARLDFHFLNDATPRTITWNAAFILPSWTQDTAANARNSVSFTYNGTSWIQDSATLVDLSTAQAIGVLAAGRFPALTGDVTNTAGSLATTVGQVTAKLASYDGKATAGEGVPPIYAYLTGAAQSATVGPLNLQCGAAICPAGLYRVSVYHVITTSDLVATIAATVGWNDATAARSQTAGRLGGNISCAATNYDEDVVTVRADGTNNITFTDTVTGTIGLCRFSYYVTLERLQ